MELSEAVEKQFVMVIDPNSFDYGDPTTFVSSYYNENLELAVVAKNEHGRVSFRSFSAPKDSRFPEYFSNFIQIASEFDIPCHAFMHSFGDAFLGADPNYSVEKSGGNPISQFVCPSNTSFWKYGSTIAKEISRFPISSLIIDEHYFPRLDYCFCRRCRIEFRNMTGMEFDIALEDILGDEDLLFRYVDWRSETVANSLSEIVQTFKQEKPDTPVFVVIPIDPELDWITGAAMHLGLDLDFIAEIIDGVVFSVQPFSPMYPMTGTQPWLQLAERIKSVSRKFPHLKVSLMLNGLEQEWDISWFIDLFQEIRGFRMFGKMAEGQLYNLKREVIRGTDTTW